MSDRDTALREAMRRNAAAALERVRKLEGHVRLNLSCALAQRTIWCPVCGDVHMLAARCATPPETTP